MAKAAQTARGSDEAVLEDRLPEMLDDVLGQLSEVGVDRILRLAGEMVEARLESSSTAHLEPWPGQEN